MIAEVALALGISKGTVSRAITGKGRIAAATKARVLDYMAEHDLSPNAIAQNLSSRKSMTIAYTVPTDPKMRHLSFYLSGMIGAIDRAMITGYDILSISNSPDAVRRVVGQGKVDAVIVSRDPGDEVTLPYLQQAGLPFVLIGPTRISGITRVDHDHQAACLEFTTAILQRWTGKAGLILGSRDDLVSQARDEGFTAAAPDSPVAWNALDETSTVAAAEQLVELGVDIVFCGDDSICVALETAMMAGRIHPAIELRLASFHNSPALEALNPRIPAIQFDSSAVGAAACSAVLKQLGGEHPVDSIIGYQLVIGDRDGHLARGGQATYSISVDQ
ncbi:MAG: LacI family transcriptional regulator [Propionibacteriaceae bacterium]|jgi:DNA-binding LacI/PurR family transcriptional regulator|nr:LacI family transcriptional regulator [Propionibacteriaceae bacterium]